MFDLEAAARANVPPAHWGYLQTGVDGDLRCAPIKRRSPATAPSAALRRREPHGPVGTKCSARRWPRPFSSARSAACDRSTRKASGRGPRWQGEERAADALHPGVVLSGGRHRRARCARVVPALHDGSVRGHEEAREARGGGGLPGGRRHRGPARWPKPGDTRAMRREDTRICSGCTRCGRSTAIPGGPAPSRCSRASTRRVSAAIRSRSPGTSSSAERHHQHEGGDQGNRGARRCRARGQTRRGRHHRLQSRRPRHRKRARHDRVAAGSREGRGGRIPVSCWTVACGGARTCTRRWRSAQAP